MRDILANELRIGNFVRLNIYGHDHEDDYCKITGITEEDLRVNVADFDHLEPQEVEPIPLTEDWLVKFGFLRLGDGFEFWESSVFNIEYIRNHWRVCYISNVLCTHLKYAHELQNLYFALTGQELTLSP